MQRGFLKKMHIVFNKQVILNQKKVEYIKYLIINNL